jgi:PAS domain S-box-containing protein
MTSGPQARSQDYGPAQADEPDFESFFAASLDLLVIRDRDLRILKVNRAWETILGYRMDELEGQPMLAFIHPDDIAPSHTQMQRVRSEMDVKGFVNRYRCKDGGYRHLEWRARQEGGLVYGVARDVTERLALEAEMANARIAAEAANKAKSEFLANISHEIRTPLNGVIGIAGALAQTDLTSAQREMVELIMSSGQTLERVVSDVLDFSKIEAGRLEIEIQPFELRAQADSLTHMFDLRAKEKGLGFSVTYGEGVRGWFKGDAVRIRQVLGNLISNAIKFTEAGEVAVSIEVGETGHDAVALIAEVRDTGIGFDDETQRRLFQRFSQADGSITRRFGGTGLGLSICQALVEMMGGEIRVASKPGEGSLFTVVVPLIRHAPGAAAANGAQAALSTLERMAAEPLTVLLAEDHIVNQRVIELILAPAGITLTKVENGAQAVDAFRAADFDLVLMDMQMPVMDGLAATRAIRALEAEAGRARTPILMLSANAMRQHAEEAVVAGADLHLAKPVTPQSLLGAVAGLIGVEAAA